MASTDANGSGVYAWMASVRASMDNDSCRKIFEDQVQSHAFIFLDNYLEHILAGPKQGPIIDLVKTPGRRKNVPRGTRAATAAAATVKNSALFSLELDDDKSAKSNIPVNSFHKALLSAKERSLQDALGSQKFPAGSSSMPSGSAEKTNGRSESVQVTSIPEITVSIEHESQADAVPLQHYPRDPPSESSTPFLASEHGIALSVIAEGDESPERSHATIRPLSTLASNQDGSSQAAPQVHYGMREHSATEGVSKIIQTDHTPQEEPLPDARHLAPSTGGNDHDIPLKFPREVQPSEVSTTNRTERLPSGGVANSSDFHERNAFTAPLPVVPVSNPVSIPHTISVPLNDLSPKSLPHKNGAPGFPMLPAPSPLRKSVRITQDALTGSIPPTIVPVPVPFGKRTSWLMKAREAKAMEGTNSLLGTSMIAVSAGFSRAPTAVKRKSGEMLGGLPSEPDMDKDQRQPKIPKSTEASIVPVVFHETEKTIQPDFPSEQGDTVALSSIAALTPVDHSESHTMDVDKQITHPNSAEQGFIDLFKRTVEDLGARAGKSAGKSLGGAAVAALAEARAAAEARVAERNKVNSEIIDIEALRSGGGLDQESPEIQSQLDDQIPFTPAPGVGGTERRLSLSDLVPDTVQHGEPESSAGAGEEVDSGDDSISTTPPDSPPSKSNSRFVKPAGPVFNKPPVFVPPISKQPSIASEHPPGFSSGLPAVVSLGIPPRLMAPGDAFLPLAQGTPKFPAQSSQSGIFSNPVFDKHDEAPTWVPSTKDTIYTSDSQVCDPQPPPGAMLDDDDDDSWPLEEKLAAAEPGWRPFDFSNVDKEDTWSSLPTESQGPTRRLTTETHGDTIPPGDTNKVGNKIEELEQEKEAAETLDPDCSTLDTVDLEEVVEAGIGSPGSMDLEPSTRATSQASMASTTSSSQSQAGFFRQATKLVNNMLGGKKAKPELKSLQLAAAAAKKQQEDADKKMRRLKDMEARRQVAVAKKAEEERTRILEEQKKSKEEFERRKREREENTDRRPLKPPVSIKKADDDASKKRKLAPETERKQESKRAPSKDKKDLAPPTKMAVTPAAKPAASKGMKASTVALVSSTAYNATQNPPSAKSTMPEAKPFKVVPPLKGKGKPKPQEDDTGDKLPSTVIQSQMAARAKAQMQAATAPTPEVPSESIELPEINSEYSDSEDEDRARTFDPPEWAQSPELRQALQMQSTVNPDDIFGGIRPLRMEEMFRTRQSRFRARTSSANWTGSDRLTTEEIHEYERRMGFQQTRAS